MFLIFPLYLKKFASSCPPIFLKKYYGQPMQISLTIKYNRNLLYCQVYAVMYSRFGTVSICKN